MLKFFLILSAVSTLLYLLFCSASWYRQLRGIGCGSGEPRRAYFWGLLFALLFYYGFPLWWWRYGLRKTVEILFVCISAGIVLQALLRLSSAIPVNDLGESIFLGLLLSVPIRAVAGFWVARRDAAWRNAILLRRKGNLQATNGCH
jgi:hypothetical protein